MWKKQKVWLSNKSKIQKWIKENKIKDVVLFGSLVRGKNKPNDLDLCIIIKKEQEEKTMDLIDSLSKACNKEIKIQINVLTENDLVKGNSLFKTILIEGFSIKQNKSFADNYGWVPKALFFYDIKKSKASDKVRFHYLLRGRYGQPGLLANNKAELIKDGLIEVPIDSEDLFREVLDSWKINYEVKRVLFS